MAQFNYLSFYIIQIEIKSYRFRAKYFVPKIEYFYSNFNTTIFSEFLAHKTKLFVIYIGYW